MKDKIFEGLKVIELASVLAGPAVGMFFAELGAEVLKIENKRTNGDVTRTWRLPKEDPQASISAYYCAINWNKEVLLLDLTLEHDRDQLYQLVAKADIVIANYKPSAAEKLGVDYDTLSQINKQLIYANLTGFGSDSNRVAFDVVLQAESGFMYMNGQPESPPTKMPVALIDILAAHQLKEGILVALLHKMKTGKGSLVTASLLDAAVSSLANQATNWLMADHIPQQMGSLHPNIAPYGELFLTADQQQIVLAIGNNKQFRRLCTCLNRPDLAQDSRYVDNPSRVINRIQLAAELKIAFEQVDAQYLLKTCENQQVPLGLVRNMKQVFEQPATQKLILQQDIDGIATKRVKTAVFNLHESL